jgi:ribosomal protein L2
VVKIFEATLALACVSRAFNMGGKTTWAAIRQRKLGRFLSPRDHNSGGGESIYISAAVCGAATRKYRMISRAASFAAKYWRASE